MREGNGSLGLRQYTTMVYKEYSEIRKCVYHAVRNGDTRGIDDARIAYYESPGVRYYNTPPQFERHSENIPKRAQNHTRYPKPYQITKANTYLRRLFASNTGGASLLSLRAASLHTLSGLATTTGGASLLARGKRGARRPR